MARLSTDQLLYINETKARTTRILIGLGNPEDLKSPDPGIGKTVFGGPWLKQPVITTETGPSRLATELKKQLRLASYDSPDTDLHVFRVDSDYPDDEGIALHSPPRYAKNEYDVKLEVFFKQNKLNRRIARYYCKLAGCPLHQVKHLTNEQIQEYATKLISLCRVKQEQTLIDETF